MTRLVHSQGGFVRSLQMSSARLFAFVEGRLDRSFFDRMLPRAIASGAVPHQVVAVKELPGGTGGKPSLLSTFRDFRRRRLLRMTAFGKTMVCVFFADKDSDDFCRKQLRSPHLVYSPTYDLEGHLYSCADIHRALADSCGLTVSQAQALIPDPKAWLEQVAQTWREWIALCLLSQSRSINCGCTFDRVSQVNPNPFAPPEPARVLYFKTLIAQREGLSLAETERLFTNAVKRVDASIASGSPLRYFKGKWLSHLVQRYLETKPKPPDANFSGVGERLCSTLVAQVAVGAHCNCCATYLTQVAAITAHL
jgi:hypothetical protein